MVRAPLAYLRRFSGQCIVGCFWKVSSIALAVRFMPVFTGPPTRLEQPASGLPNLRFLRHAEDQTVSGGAGILTGFPSTTPFGLALGPA